MGHSSVVWENYFGNDSLFDIYYYHSKDGDDNDFLFNCHTNDCSKVHMLFGDQANIGRLYEVIK